MVPLPGGESLCFPHEGQGRSNHYSPSLSLALPKYIPGVFTQTPDFCSFPPAAAGVGEAAFAAMAGHQDPVTCFPVSAKVTYH